VIFLLIELYALSFATPLADLGQAFGWLSALCIAIQYLLAIPLALSLRRHLRQQAPAWIDVATIIGVGSLLIYVVLETALVVRSVTWRQLGLWNALDFLGVGSWLVSTGLVARSTGRFSNSLRVSIPAALHLGYPVSAFWLARRLRSSG
jgi:hypothetical protein